MSEPGHDRVVVFDTTLRDGEQSPGASMNLSQKLRVAKALAELAALGALEAAKAKPARKAPTGRKTAETAMPAVAVATTPGRDRA